MKRIVTLVAAFAMMAAGSVANAADNAWFSLEGGGAVGEGPGQPLVVQVPSGGGTVRISYNFTAAQQAPGNPQDGMLGWAIRLGQEGGTAVAAFAGGGAYSTTGYTNNFPGVEIGPSLIAGQTSDTGDGSAGLVYSFDLNVTGPDGTAALIGGDFGPSEQAYNNGYAWYGFVGPNPISYGRVGYAGGVDTTAGWGQSPVIIVNVIPEPATLGLIGLGVFALIRRRR
ncbi:MAG TPA: PEP-CTERM sorting domain-containing protein [Phycisphaerae bacterium]|nr:PEP-CTERM sorting domain-containing protein [Phycisphaerae bacterium]